MSLPVIFDFDAVNEPACGCESCTTEWGLEFPLVRAVEVLVACGGHH